MVYLIIYLILHPFSNQNEFLEKKLSTTHSPIVETEL